MKTVRQYVICVRNQGYEVSLEKRKIYRITPDKTSSELRLVKIIDESGQPYLYPQQFFIPIRLSQPVLKAIDRAA